MAGSVNKVILVGNLGQDPKIRHTKNSNKIANLSIATSESWKDKQTGERREKTEWHRVVIFNEHLANVAEKYLRKGSKVYVEGSLQTRKWTGNDGVEKFSTEVVLNRFRGVLTMLDTLRDGGESREEPRPASSGGGESEPAGTDLDDEIPFITPWDIQLGKVIF